MKGKALGEASEDADSEAVSRKPSQVEPRTASKHYSQVAKLPGEAEAGTHREAISERTGAACRGESGWRVATDGSGTWEIRPAGDRNPKVGRGRHNRARRMSEVGVVRSSEEPG